MKKFLKPILFAVMILVLLVAGLAIYGAFQGKEMAEQATFIQDAANDTHMFNTTLSWDNAYDAITFEIQTERDIQLHTWAMSLLGSASISVINSNGEIVFHSDLRPSYKAYAVHLTAGQYRVKLHLSKAFIAGGIVGVNYQSYYISQIRTLSDTDGDGLPDEMEGISGTDPGLSDTDGDALSDYVEVVKYGTNPLRADSDGDGVPDGDWNERREYTYTVRVLLKIREPFNLETMNDLYQDVRSVGDPDEAGYTPIEAIIYPEAHPVLNASSFPPENLPPELQTYSQPGIAANYDAEMQAEVLQLVAGSTTDVQVVGRVLQWVNHETNTYIDYSIPEVYFTYIDGDEVRVRNYHDALPVDELLRTHYFAVSMFREHTHGTCTSIATLKCAMLKAAGIPCRVIQTVFPIYYHASQDEPYTNSLQHSWDANSCSYNQPAGDSFDYANHAFLEVYIGGQWLRVDQDLGIFQQQSNCMGLKILSVADWSEVDFSQTWPVDWIHERPYYTSLIEDQESRQ